MPGKTEPAKEPEEQIDLFGGDYKFEEDVLEEDFNKVATQNIFARTAGTSPMHRSCLNIVTVGRGRNGTETGRGKQRWVSLCSDITSPHPTAMNVLASSHPPVRPPTHMTSQLISS